MDTPNSQSLAFSLNYPSLVDRVQSTFIDTLFIVLVMFMCTALLDRYTNPPDWIRIVLFFGLWTVYEPLSTSMGGTIGNYIKGIRVRKHSAPDKKINFFQAFVRYFLKVMLGWLSFITMHTNKQRRAIHDLVAGTVMVKLSDS